MAKKFLDLEGLKHFISRIIGKTDISKIGDGTCTGAIRALNQSLEGLTCVKYVTETLTVSANVWREYTFKNLPNHKLSIAMIMSGDDVSKTNGCYVRRNFDTTGKIYVYSPISQNLQIALIMFIF